VDLGSIPQGVNSNVFRRAPKKHKFKAPSKNMARDDDDDDDEGHHAAIDSGEALLTRTPTATATAIPTSTSASNAGPTSTSS
jgi:hypothetical protein